MSSDTQPVNTRLCVPGTVQDLRDGNRGAPPSRHNAWRKRARVATGGHGVAEPNMYNPTNVSSLGDDGSARGAERREAWKKTTVMTHVSCDRAHDPASWVGRGSQVEMMMSMALIYKVLFPSIATFDTPPAHATQRSGASCPHRSPPGHSRLQGWAPTTGTPGRVTRRSLGSTSSARSSIRGWRPKQTCAWAINSTHALGTKGVSK